MITQNFYYYTSGNSDDNPGVSSGAYIFRPDITTPFIVPTNVSNNTVTYIRSFSGNVVDEFHQYWSSYMMDLSQIIRVYKDEGYIEFDWIVGNLNM